MVVKKKSSRIKIIIECTNCIIAKKNLVSQHSGISRYITIKNRKNTPNKLELLKYCVYCNAHTSHKQIK